MSAPSAPWRAPGIELASHSTAEGTAMAPNITLLDLVNAVAELARSEGEVIATIVCMVNQGRLRLCGTFRGGRIDLTKFTAARTKEKSQQGRRRRVDKIGRARVRQME